MPSPDDTTPSGDEHPDAVHSGAPESDTDGSAGAGDASGKPKFTRAERIRFAVYAVLLAVGIGLLIWQLAKDDPRTPIVLGVFAVSEDEMREASTRESPIYWLGPDPLPTRTMLTAGLPGEKRSKITQNLRGAFFYDAVNNKGVVRSDPEAPYATIYTRTIDGPTRANINTVKRECAKGRCPNGLVRITGPFGEAFVEPNSSGGWMARMERGNALIFVSAGKPLLPKPTLMRVRPFDEGPLSDVTPRG